MFERFTPRARKIMALANQAARQLNHEYIDSEHILLGLVQEGRGVGAEILKKHNVNLLKVHHKLNELVLPDLHSIPAKKLPLTPLARDIIRHAIDEARLLSHDYVGTEHLLLALLHAQESPAAIILRNLGLDLDTTRNEVRDLLDTDTNASDPP